MSILLQTRKLSCGYGSCSVLTDVDLEVRAGEVLVLIGPNGAGKTTLLHTLARLLKPRGGSIEVLGKPLAEHGPRELARVLALAPQRALQSAWPLTVRESVALGRAPHRGWLLPLTRADNEAVDAAMERMGVSDLARRSVATLSGGEVRRVILARALAQAPRILLLDEPATYLDLRYQAELLDAVRSLAHAEGLGVVMTIHDLPLAALCADRMALLEPGRVRAVGSPREVLREDLLHGLYGPNLEVLHHPATGAPLVLPTRAEDRP